MKCPRCGKENSYEMTFYFEHKRVKLVARVCRVCEYLYAEDEDLLRAARQHLRELVKWTKQSNQ